MTTLFLIWLGLTVLLVLAFSASNDIALIVVWPWLIVSFIGVVAIFVYFPWMLAVVVGIFIFGVIFSAFT